MAKSDGTKTDASTDLFKPVTRDDMTDLALLPRRFDMFAFEVKESFTRLSAKLLPFMQRMEAAVTDIRERVGELERHRIRLEDRIEALEQKPKRRKAKR